MQSTPSAIKTPRLSFPSATKELEEGGFAAIKTPDNHGADGELEAGALRPGGAPKLTSPAMLGLMYQYAAVGLIAGVLPSTIYPFLMMYLNASGAQYATAVTLVSLPNSFKVFFGIVSDCFPIFGYRRRPYMIVGWTVCLTMLITMASLQVGEPYYSVAADRYVDPSLYTPEIEARINFSAPSDAARYVMLMFFSALGYVISDSCADGIMAAVAQREPENVRGKTQTTTHAVQIFVTMLAYLLVGFCFNGEEYGGTFSFSLSFPQLMIILAVLTAPTIPVTWFFIDEGERFQKRPQFRAYIKDLFDQICKRAVYQVVAALFFYYLIVYISYTSYSVIQSYMVKVTPLNSTLAGVFSYFFYLLGIMATSKWGLQWNWRWMIIITGAMFVVIDCTANLIIVWDVYRSQWFWLGPPIVAQLPNGFGYMVSMLVIVELVGQGNEGAMYGLMATLAGIASPFATTLTLIIDRPFNITNARVQTDDESVHWDITYTVLIAYLSRIFSWVFLLLLPKQKRQTQELLRNGGSSRLIGGITVFYLSFSLVWAVMTNIMAIFDSTSCLIIAGGSGC